MFAKQIVRLLFALAVGLVVVAGATDSLAGDEYRMDFNVGAGGIPGVQGPGTIYGYGWGPNPLSVSGLTGCLDTSVCRTCNGIDPKYEGVGGGYATPGALGFDTWAKSVCPGQVGDQGATLAWTYFRIDDLVFSGPGGGAINVALNLEVVMETLVGDGVNTDAGSFSFDIVTPGGIFRASGWSGGVSGGNLSGLVSGVPYPFSTGTFSVPLNTPTSLEIQVSGGASGHQYGVSMAVDVNFSAGAVFQVPEGVTVTSEQAEISDNMWQVHPIPTTEASMSTLKSRFGQ